jgi:hypothetical protein
MPPVTRKKIKTEKFIAAGQTKLKFTAGCIDNLLNELPSQTFSHILPACCALKQTKLDSSYSSPFPLHRPLCEMIPLHPSITLFCQFCQNPIPSEQQVWYIEQPHTRRRFTPICDVCCKESVGNVNDMS